MLKLSACLASDWGECFNVLRHTQENPVFGYSLIPRSMGFRFTKKPITAKSQPMSSKNI